MTKKIPMEKNVYLDFQGKEIQLHLEDGTWWIVAKSVTDALDVDWRHQHRKLTQDKKLGQVIGLKEVFVSGQIRSVICIPEKFVYGWLFKIDSDNPILDEYQWKCYDLMYDHFKGTIAQRQQILSTLSEEEMLIKELQEKIDNVMNEIPEYKELQELKKNKKVYTKKLTELDQSLIKKQLKLWD